MKIAHLITGKVFAGIEQHVFELAHFMEGQTTQIILCEDSIKNNFIGLDSRTFKLGSRYSPGNIFRLVALIKREGIDLLHCHGAKSSFVGGLVGSISKVKIISTAHGVKHNYKAFQKSDAIIAVSKELASDIAHSTYISNWFNPSHINALSSRTGPIVAIGRLESVKAFDHLIQSWVNVDAKLEIIGSGPQEPYLQKLISTLGLSSKITLVTDRSYDDIELKYETASGLVISSHREGGPRVALEAMNYGIPVIGTRVGILSELLPKELLSDPSDQKALQSLIEKIVPLLAQLDVSAIQESIKDYYSIENAASKTKKIYYEVLNASK